MVLHVAGAVLFIGSLLLAVWWKWRADRSGDARLAAFTLDGLVAGDLRFTASGALLILVGGGGMLALGTGQLAEKGWLSGGIILFLIAALAWAVVLVPLQRQLRALARGAGDGPLPDAYRRMGRICLLASAVANLAALAALILMVAKPGG
jgi:uncharacterized membrane protein